MANVKTRPYHGTCLLNGKHPPGSPEARECPLRSAAARSARSRKAAATRWQRQGARREHADVPQPLPDAPAHEKTAE